MATVERDEPLVEDHQETAAIGPEQILSQFEAALRDQEDLDEEGFEFLMGHLRDAVESASLQPELQELDRNTWIRTFDAIVGEHLDESDRNAFIRQLNEAIDPLNSAGVQIATEFARRLQADGETAALNWLAEQRAIEQARTQSPAPASDDAAQRQSITRSRSRRLRGPPR